MIVLGLLLLVCRGSGAESPNRITVLYDAFGRESVLRMDWGFAALVEFAGKRILFDTGNNREIFAHNTQQLGVDLTRLDAVVISHRHGDHTTGLGHLARLKVQAPVYAPFEGAYFGMIAPREFYARDPSLPEDLQYFRGREPELWRAGTPWENLDFRVVRDRAEIAPRIHVVSTQSEKPGSMEMHELSLVLVGEDGVSVVVGCSHPGVEKIVAAAQAFGTPVQLVTGGFHLVMTRPTEIQRVADVLQHKLGVRRVAPGHCTGETGFAIFRRAFGTRFETAGLGAVLEIP